MCFYLSSQRRYVEITEELNVRVRGRGDGERRVVTRPVGAPQTGTVFPTILSFRPSPRVRGLSHAYRYST
jgi:hypothetical protein